MTSLKEDMREMAQVCVVMVDYDPYVQARFDFFAPWPTALEYVIDPLPLKGGGGEPEKEI